MQSLLSASCPWIPHLPGMLAQNPLLLLKVRGVCLLKRCWHHHHVSIFHVSFASHLVVQYHNQSSKTRVKRQYTV